MDLSLIERLIVMLGQSPLQSLDVTEGNLRIRLSKSALPVEADGRAIEPVAVVPVRDIEGSSRLTIRAGLSGTFYRAPSPGAEPFVREGSRVEEGATLALVEAMKMLNPVEAERAGCIVRIHLEDAATVEPGMALFDIEIDPS